MLDDVTEAANQTAKPNMQHPDQTNKLVIDQVAQSLLVPADKPVVDDQNTLQPSEGISKLNSNTDEEVMTRSSAHPDEFDSPNNTDKDLLAAAVRRLDSFQCFQLMDSLALKYDTLVSKANFTLKNLPDNLLNFISINDVEIIKSVGLGAQGEIFLCKLTESYLNNIYLKKTGLSSFNNLLALKVMGKEEISKNMHRSFFEIEREILCKSLHSNWLLGMHASFQDEFNIYFLTDYLSGGDLFALLEEFGEFSIELIRIYAAYTICALEELHLMGFIHRDIKPDNLLIDAAGHIKLADFGSSIKNKGFILNTGIPIGTPDYISVEVLNLQQKYKQYNETCDFWSLGVMLYELWYDELPFHHENLTETYKKINSIDFCFPNGHKRQIPHDLKDLIRNLIIEPEKRLNIKAIKKHLFFESINFDDLKSIKPIYVPPPIDLTVKIQPVIKKKPTNSHNQFLGFSYDPIVLEEVIIQNQFIAPSVRRTTLGRKSVPSVYYSNMSNEDINNKKENNENIQKEITLLTDKLRNLQFSIKKQEEKKETLTKEIEELNDKLAAIGVLQDNNKNINATVSLEKYNKLVEVVKSNQTLHKNLNQKISSIEEDIKSVENAFQLLIGFMKTTSKSKPSNTKDIKKNREEISNLLLKIEQLEFYIKSLEISVSKYKNLNDKLKVVKTTNLEFNIKIRLIFKNNQPINNYKSLIRDEQGMLKIDNNNIKINKLIHPLANTLIKDVSEYEITSLRGLDRNSMKFILLMDSIQNIKFSRNKRVDINSLKSNINNKKKMYESFCNLKISNKESLKHFDIQKENLLVQIKELEKEYKKVQESSEFIEEQIEEEEEVLHEFKNHVFKMHKFSDVILCAFCSKALTNNAGYECKFCNMSTHEGCFSSVRETCEFYQAVAKGLTVYVNAENQSDKDALFAMFDRS
ncbi:Serine/threonine-protein kinase MRCK beta [Cucumispora dikerogammari]|nr:Serine/threonine-protein kinase MRCK beta [Cucumispora dikerogammari]